MHEGEAAITLASRLMLGANPVFGNGTFWQGTNVVLPESLLEKDWHNRLGGNREEEISDLEHLFAEEPIAFLTTWDDKD